MLDQAFTTDTIDRYIPGLRRQTAPPTLDQLLPDLSGLPHSALLLGLCEDGLPLVVDLAEPDSGALLIASDSGFENTTFLHSILATAFELNPVADLNIHLISPHADDLFQFHRQPNFRICYEPFRPEVEIVLEEMVNLVDGRQRKQVSQPFHLLAVDDLDLLFQSISPQAKLHMQWLIEHGPESGLWVIGTVESTSLSEGLAALLDRFPSRILGRIRQPNLARQLSSFSRSYLGDLAPGEAYFVCEDRIAIHLRALELTGV